MQWRGDLTQEQFDRADITQSYSGCVSIAITGTPSQNYYNILGLASTGGKYCTQFASNVNRTNAFYLRQAYGSAGYGPWVRIATATPPQEFDLPLASYLIVASTSSYRKNQFGEVTWGFMLKAVAPVADGAIVAILPQGYRPNRQSVAACNGIIGTARFGGGTIGITLSGNMVYNGPQLETGNMIWAQGSFVAQ